MGFVNLLIHQKHQSLQVMSRQNLIQKREEIVIERLFLLLTQKDSLFAIIHKLKEKMEFKQHQKKD